MKRQRVSPSKWTTTIFVIIFCSLLSGWIRPQLPTDTVPTHDFPLQLQHLSIEVNGVLQTVQNGGTLRLVRGDRIKVVNGALKDNTRSIEVINVVGFSNYKSRRGDDRGIEFSSFDLLERWSENKSDSHYAVVASTGKLMHGHVFISIVEPVLKFAVLDINGREVVLRDGELFSGNAEDKVKVKRISTNVTGNENVFVQVVAVGKENNEAGMFEMRFLREKIIFARLPLKLEK